MNASANDWVRPEIAAIQAYSVTDAQNCIKLDAMENPWPMPERLQRLLAEKLAYCPINRYPDPAAPALKHALRQTFAIPASADILLGNGSDEIITLITQTLAKPGAKLLALEPSFVMYKMNALFSRLDYVGVNLKADFSLNLGTVLQAIEQHQPAVVMVAYPNNPTGPSFARQEIKTICQHAPGLVVIDEAYQTFAKDSFMDMAGGNIVVMRTLSKLGLAGIRLGYAAGSTDWISQINKVRPPYNINILTQISALFALEHINVFQQQAAAICEERTRLFQTLSALPNAHIFPSDTNFLTLRIEKANALFLHLKTNGILVKNLHGSHALLDNCLRITIGTPHENDAVIHSIHQFFNL